MLELRHLRTLYALRSAGSLVRAAQLLNLTQSALSHQIKLLEERYGAPLFARKSQPISFSATGARLLKLADLLLPEVEQAEREVVRLSQSDQGQLRVALTSYGCLDWLMPVLDQFRCRWPEVDIDLLADGQSDAATLLANGAADLAIGSAPLDGCASFPLFRYEILVALAHKHRLHSRRRLCAADFAGETLIGYPPGPVPDELEREVLAPAGIVCERRSAELTVAILQLVASRRGIAALPAWSLQRYLDDAYVQARPVGDGGLWGALYASVPAPLQERAYVRDFVSMVREQCAASLDGIKLIT